MGFFFHLLLIQWETLATSETSVLSGSAPFTSSPVRHLLSEADLVSQLPGGCRQLLCTSESDAFSSAVLCVISLSQAPDSSLRNGKGLWTAPLKYKGSQYSHQRQVSAAPLLSFSRDLQGCLYLSVDYVGSFSTYLRALYLAKAVDLRVSHCNTWLANFINMEPQTEKFWVRTSRFWLSGPLEDYWEGQRWGAHGLWENVERRGLV